MRPALVVAALAFAPTLGCTCDGSVAGQERPPQGRLDGSTASLDGGPAPDGALAGGDGAVDGLDAGAVSDAGSAFVRADGGAFLCGDHVCACSNGLDDEATPDGRIDGDDPECAGPADDDEATFGTGVPGDNRDPNCQDCFFDGNSGSGDDKCRYATSCTTMGDPSSGSGSCMTCDVTPDCLANCAPLTPNGCDCFGCCEVRDAVGGVHFILLGQECSLATIDSCTSCVQSDDCVNECGRCELCPGKDVADLPEDCGGTATCEGGATPCATTADCDTATEYCSLGCCVASLLG